ncbi:MAG TPA: hypothetical protein VFO73_13265 [Candidatus Limnocylindrales bacterium]|nr:hypothetical protein [Candidatus Limnocylindrales bacterium]
MAGVIVVIFHPEPRPGAGPLERWVGEQRRALAERHATGFVAAGAATDDVRIVAGTPDDTPFGARLRAFVAAERPAGLVVLGSGSVPLATAADLRAFLAAASGSGPEVLTNSRFSADIVAVARPDVLLGLPDHLSDNGLPRWLAEAGGCAVTERRSARLSVDIDGPLDLLLAGGRGAVGRPLPPPGIDLAAALAALAGVRSVAADPRAELVVAGRTSASTLAWLERNAAARVRAFVEERGLRAATSPRDPGAAVPPNRRPPRSLLGTLLERDGAAALGGLLAGLGDGAVVDSRVLMAHRLGADDGGWPAPEDRYASDLLLPDRVADPWLRELTHSAATAAIPIVLGGHTLVGPGLRFALRGGWGR